MVSYNDVINYQEYLMEIGAAPQLVRMGAVIKGIQNLWPKKEEISIGADGEIIIIGTDAITKFSVNGEEAIKEHLDFKDSDLIFVTYIDKYGMEYLTGRYSKYTRSTLPDTKIDSSDFYKSRKGRIIEFSDSESSIMMGGFDASGQTDSDCSCVIEGIENDYFQHTLDQIQEIQLKNMTATILDYPISSRFYIENGLITEVNMASLLSSGVDLIAAEGEKFIKNNTSERIEQVPVAFHSLFHEKTSDEIEAQNKVVRDAVEKYKGLKQKLANGETIPDPTVSYTEEVARERRKYSEGLLLNKLERQQVKTKVWQEKYEKLKRGLDKLSKNFLFKGQSSNVLSEINDELKKDTLTLKLFKDESRTMEICENIVQSIYLAELYKNACNLAERYLSGFDNKGLKGKYVNSIMESGNEEKAKGR